MFLPHTGRSPVCWFKSLSVEFLCIYYIYLAFFPETNIPSYSKKKLNLVNRLLQIGFSMFHAKQKCQNWQMCWNNQHIYVLCCLAATENLQREHKLVSSLQAAKKSATSGCCCCNIKQWSLTTKEKNVSKLSIDCNDSIKKVNDVMM